MITFELAEKLKDAGFPKKIEEYTICDTCKHPCPPIENHGYPTIEELIQACGNRLISIERCDMPFNKIKKGWKVIGFDNDKFYYNINLDLEESLLKLWLELNK